MANTDYFKQFTNNTFDGKTKGDIKDLVNTGKYHIDEVYFRTGDNGEYAQFSVREIADKFFNAPSVVTQVLTKVRDDDMLKQLPAVAWTFETRVSKAWNSEYIVMIAALGK